MSEIRCSECGALDGNHYPEHCAKAHAEAISSARAEVVRVIANATCELCAAGRKSNWCDVEGVEGWWHRGGWCTATTLRELAKERGWV